MSIVLLYFKRHKVLYGILIFTILFSVLSAFVPSHIDLLDFDYRWVRWIKQNGIWNIYHMCNECVTHTCSRINYPPMYPLFLWLVSEFVGEPHSYATQFFLKLLPAVLFMVSQVWIYFKISERVAVLWTFSLPFIFNALCWGQRDVIFIFFMVAMFYNIEKDKSYGAAIWFTMACLLKPQGILLLPILLLYLLQSGAKLKHKCLSLCSGLGIGIMVFLPFMIAEKSVLTFFTPYLYNGVNSRINGMAPNIWFLLQGRFGEMSFDVASMLFVLVFVLSIGVFIFTYTKTKDIMVSAAVYMFTYFILNVGQTERYSLYVLVCLFFMMRISKNKYQYKQDFKLLQRSYRYCYISCFLAQFATFSFTNIVIWLYVRFGYYDKYGCFILHELYPDLDYNAVSNALSTNLKFVEACDSVVMIGFGLLVIATILMMISYFVFLYTVFHNRHKLGVLDQNINNIKM